MRPLSASLLPLSLLLSSWSSPSHAHDKWLEVEPASAPAAQRLKVYLVTGDAFREAELIPERRRAKFARFVLHSSAGKRDLTGDLREDQQPIAILEEAKAPSGTAVLQLDTTPIDVELSASKFQAYLFEERLIDILWQRAQKNLEDHPGRERYSRSLKAIVQLGPRQDKIATRPVGQELELVPLSHPSALKPGGMLSVQLLFRGKPLSGRSVVCANRARGTIAHTSARTDGSGKVSFAVGKGGDWLLSTVHMEASSEPQADWRSYWASLVFAVPEKK